MTDTPRTVLAVTGADRVSFLQGLITNDVDRAFHKASSSRTSL